MYSANLSMLVEEHVALMTVRNTGDGWSLSPQVANLGIRGIPKGKQEKQNTSRMG